MSEIVRKRRPVLSQKQFLRDTEQHIKELQALSMFSDTTELSSAERKARAAYDFDYFCTIYLPIFFTDEKAEWHEEFDADIDATDAMLAVTAMRGGGKSTRLFAHEMHFILFRRVKYIVHCLDAWDKASSYTEAILIELRYNERIKHDFGMMVSMTCASGDYTTFDPVTHQNVTRVHAFGIEMGFRGLREGATRPDMIVFEDIQSREAAESESRSAKTLRVIHGDARSALVPSGYRFINLGNVICHDSVTDQLLNENKNLAWTKRRYPAIITENGVRRSTFPSRFPLELLDKIREEIGDDLFDIEYMCKAIEVGRIFNEKRDLHYWQTLPTEIDLSNPTIQIDQAESGYSDYSAIGVGVRYVHHQDRPDFATWCDSEGKIFGEGVYLIILEVFLRQIGIDEVIDEAAEIIDRYQAMNSYWDGSVNKELIWERFIGSWEARNNKSLPVTFDKFYIPKELRIKALQPIMGRRKLLLPPHTSPDMLELRKQILRFGNGGTEVHDDGPDMLAALNENADPEQANTTEVTLL